MPVNTQHQHNTIGWYSRCEHSSELADNQRPYRTPPHVLLHGPQTETLNETDSDSDSGGVFTTDTIAPVDHPPPPPKKKGVQVLPSMRQNHGSPTKAGTEKRTDPNRGGTARRRLCRPRLSRSSSRSLASGPAPTCRGAREIGPAFVALL